MPLNIVGAIVAGLAGTAAMTMLLMIAPMMGMPKMDIPGMLGSMFGAPGSKPMGFVMHFMMGVVFAIIYAFLFSVIAGPSLIVLGLIFGAVHWLIVGVMMAVIPMMHAGMRSGDVPAPGMYMMKSGGMMSFIGGLMGHLLFGVIVAVVYKLFA
jgi:hypothetical protein